MNFYIHGEKKNKQKKIFGEIGFGAENYSNHLVLEIFIIK